jgi:hypothetical protein
MQPIQISLTQRPEVPIRLRFIISPLGGDDDFRSTTPLEFKDQLGVIARALTGSGKFLTESGNDIATPGLLLFVK